MRTVSAVAVVVWATWASAAKTVVVSGGDCADPSLISGLKDFRDTASKLLGPQLIDAEVVLDIVRPRPTRSVQDIDRQVESARALFYDGQGERALELLERALAELERASPEAKPWAVTQSALVLRALVLKNLERTREMNESFRRIVRIDPNFKLNLDAHSPTAIAALDAVKREVARARKATLYVRAETGIPATVFVDGRPMGATPLRVDLLPGIYRVSLATPTMLSFPHRIELSKETKLSIDLSFEGSLGQHAPLCLSGSDDGTAIKLAQLITADNVIIVRNTAKRGAPPYISGSLYALSTAQQQRSGSVQPEFIANLATFLITGKEQLGVRRPGEPVEEEVVVPPVLIPAAPIEVAVPDATSLPANWGRIVSYTLMGVGLATSVAGIITYFLGDPDRLRFEGIVSSTGGRIPSTDRAAGAEALELIKSIDGNRAASFTLIGAGAGSIAAGALGLWLFPSASASLSVSPQSQGASMQLSGSF